MLTSGGCEVEDHYPMQDYPGVLWSGYRAQPATRARIASTTPSLVGAGLLDVPPEHLRLAGQGLRDTTRIAGSDPRLWQDIIAANARAVRVELTEILADLQRLVQVLDDPAEVRDFLERGRRGVRLPPGKDRSSGARFGAGGLGVPRRPRRPAGAAASRKSDPR